MIGKTAQTGVDVAVGARVKVAVGAGMVSRCGVGVGVDVVVEMGAVVSCSIGGVDGPLVWPVGVIDAAVVPPGPHAASTVPITIQQVRITLFLRTMVLFLSFYERGIRLR